jgi:hypothetical protein
VQVEDVAVACVDRRDDVGLPVDDETDVADERLVEDCIDRLAVVFATFRVALHGCPRRRHSRSVKASVVDVAERLVGLGPSSRLYAHFGRERTPEVATRNGLVPSDRESFRDCFRG